MIRVFLETNTSPALSIMQTVGGEYHTSRLDSVTIFGVVDLDIAQTAAVNLLTTVTLLPISGFVADATSGSGATKIAHLAVLVTNGVPGTMTTDQALDQIHAVTGNPFFFGTSSGTISGPAVSVDSEIMLFSGTTGKVAKRATGTGLVTATVGVYGTIQAGSASLLFGRGAAAGAGNYEPINLGTGLQMVGTTLNVNVTGVIIGPTPVVDSEMVLFDGTTGQLVKRATGSGMVLVTNGVYSTLSESPSTLIGRGSAAGAGTPQEITLGSGLIMSGAVLSVSGSQIGGSSLAFGGVKLTSGDITTTSTTFVDLTGATVTITTGAHRCRISAILNISNGTTLRSTEIDLAIDGTLQGGSGGLVISGGASDASPNWIANFTFVTAVLTAASHTFKLQWKTSGAGTSAVRAGSVCPLIFQVEELNIST